LAFIAVSLRPDAAPAGSLSKTKDIRLLHEEKWRLPLEHDALRGENRKAVRILTDAQRF
jgi:hypothetical protein